MKLLSFDLHTNPGISISLGSLQVQKIEMPDLYGGRKLHFWTCKPPRNMEIPEFVWRSKASSRHVDVLTIYSTLY
ncbi:hypothetical protein VN97_g27 [Penicillium thymicola]|uniref:Uncharacterized protein n=1 Tax=Penicillium thymicola TaxID=293382 RepID=A0AAI9TTJ7_PENTH|nr:hypothetical protein VN97_g27 [Penicillium thymicola]